ncbi:MAG TPA: D-glycero-beta-D-manno-heptose 1,7-bisphosphate 7-phosphatase [Gammaproteobacteria bacterium]|nr:D-glycero-beta-D-manno-heptose 1,7-bisphosphate 7-phosphatase [Gammaproteobacteria bacterium]
MKRLIILDRDGVINFDSENFIKSPDEWVAIPGSLEAIAKLNRAGFIVCVATNQSGIGRGLFTQETLTTIHNKMLAELHALGGHVDQIIYCPHTPDDNCACRKPKPEMINHLISTWHVSSQDTWVIGDALRDLQAGTAVGCHTILVKTGKGAQTLVEQPWLEDLLVFNDLSAATDFLCGNQAPR